MKHTLLTVLLLPLLLSNNSFSQSLKLTIPAFNSQPIVLAIHKGDFPKTIIKKVTSPNGTVEFELDKMLSGIYYIILPDSTAYEFMYDSKTPGAIEILINLQHLTYTKAPSTTMDYEEYINSINTIAKKEDSLRILMKQINIKKRELKAAFFMRDNLKKERVELQKSLILEYDTLLLGKYIKSFLKVKIPPYSPTKEESNIDSAIWMWQLNYYKKHYLDNLDLSSTELINTPVYTEKVNHYLDKISLQKPDELTKSIDYTIGKSKKNEHAYKFLTNYLLLKYNQLKNQAAYELVYLDIIQKYYLSGNAPWMEQKDIDVLAREYNSRKPLSLYEHAPEIDNLINEKGKFVSLTAIEAEYTIIYFHNYDCELCKTTGQVLQRLMFKVDPERIKTFAICLGEKDSKCKSYAKKYGMINWINGFDENKSIAMANAYNISYTPTFYILDAEKRIIGKNLTIRQLESWLDEVE